MIEEGYHWWRESPSHEWTVIYKSPVPALDQSAVIYFLPYEGSPMSRNVPHGPTTSDIGGELGPKLSPPQFPFNPGPA